VTILDFPSDLTRLADENSGLRAALSAAQREIADLKQRIRAMEIVYATAVNPSAVASPFAHLAALRR
jgi:hypothetical protein